MAWFPLRAPLVPRGWAGPHQAASPERPVRSGSLSLGVAMSQRHTKEEKPVSGVRVPGGAGANTALCVVTTARRVPASAATASYLCGPRRFHELQ